MTTKEKRADGRGALHRIGADGKMLSAPNDSTNDPRLSTANGRRLAELEALMEAAEDDPQWIDYWQEWLDLWPVVFADLMVKAVSDD